MADMFDEVAKSSLGRTARGEARSAPPNLPNLHSRNVIVDVAKLKSATPILGAAVDEKRPKVVVGIYRLKNGEVEVVV